MDNGANIQVVMTMLKVVVSTHLGQANLSELIGQARTGLEQLVLGVTQTVNSHHSKLIHRDIVIEAILFAVEVNIQFFTSFFPVWLISQ